MRKKRRKEEEENPTRTTHRAETQSYSEAQRYYTIPQQGRLDKEENNKATKTLSVSPFIPAISQRTRCCPNVNIGYFLDDKLWFTEEEEGIGGRGEGECSTRVDDVLALGQNTRRESQGLFDLVQILAELNVLLAGETETVVDGTVHLEAVTLARRILLGGGLASCKGGTRGRSAFTLLARICMATETASGRLIIRRPLTVRLHLDVVSLGLARRTSDQEKAAGRQSTYRAHFFFFLDVRSNDYDFLDDGSLRKGQRQTTGRGMVTNLDCDFANTGDELFKVVAGTRSVRQGGSKMAKATYVARP